MISKSKVGRYSMLRHKKWRDREGMFIAQGKKTVEDTIDFFEVVDIIEDAEAIRKISTLDTAPEIIAVYKIPEPSNMDLNVAETDFTLVLDGIQDPGNLGTIIRTAHWFGIKEIYCSGATVDVYNPKTVMATMGSLGKTRVIYCRLPELFAKNPVIPVYGLVLDGENLFSQNNFYPGFIVMGSEGHGVSKEVESMITRRLTIPPADPCDHPDSLNVSIATAITLSQLIK